MGNNKLSAKDLGVDLTHTCKYCGEKLSDIKINDYQNIQLECDNSSIHVCDEKKFTKFQNDLKISIKQVRKKQHDILKLKDIDENQLGISFDV